MPSIDCRTRYSAAAELASGEQAIGNETGRSTVCRVNPQNISGKRAYSCADAASTSPQARRFASCT